VARPTVPPTGRERTWPDNKIIVSKTDKKGIITYANKVFCDVALYNESELVGQNHNIIRHPDMPRCVFKLLWDTIEAGNEIFAYVVNQAKNGDHYWVLAHVTPTFDDNMNIIGYHSSRRVPRREPIELLKTVYADLLAIEKSHESPKQGMLAAEAKLMEILNAKGMEYDEFILSL
jgi:PAS domain S-box-containing protein